LIEVFFFIYLWRLCLFSLVALQTPMKLAHNPASIRSNPLLYNKLV